MQFKLEAVFTIDDPTPERLGRVKVGVVEALAAEARDIELLVDPAADELLKRGQ